MLPKNRRIPRKMFFFLAGVKQVYKNDIFLLKFVSKSGMPSRFCFSVSKKTIKSAVARNRLRRLGYRLIQKHLNEIKPGILAVFSFIKIPPDENGAELALKTILKKSKLLQ